MKTECKPAQVEFDGVSGRKLVASFDAEHITSDGGVVLLHRVDRRFGLLQRFAGCFKVWRGTVAGGDLIRLVGGHHPA